MEKGSFAGRRVLVTGGSRGIGRAIADALLAEGAQVCITGRRQADLDAALAGFGAGLRAFAVAGSADDTDHQRLAVGVAVERFGGLDTLVNNAGANPQYGPLIRADLAAVRKVFEVNVVAVVGWVQAAWEAAFESEGGVVLNLASIGGLRAGPDIGAYNASKAAVIHLTRQLARELAPRVRVNALAPAVVRTDFARALYEKDEDAVAATYPLGRLGTVSDVAAAARFLLSDEAGWVTGETLVLDGGLSIVS